jgi:hypothetical protein
LRRNVKVQMIHVKEKRGNVEVEARDQWVEARDQWVEARDQWVEARDQWVEVGGRKEMSNDNELVGCISLMG